jgi:hypothetical protein
LAIVSAGPGFAQAIDPNLCVANGPVNVVVRDGKTIYIGGCFTQLTSPPTPTGSGGVPIDSASGVVLPFSANVAGSVIAVISDGAGGWYIGGSFTMVGGLPRPNLAHVASDLSVSSWSPNADGIVDVLAVNGSTVYVGGGFTSIGGQPRNHIAALDAGTGAATGWNPDADGTVGGLALSGSTVYVCGGFTTVGGQARNSIAALDATTGAATAWDPGVSGGGVFGLAVGDSVIYVGGSFTNIGGQARSCIAALDTTTGAATDWNPAAGCTRGTCPPYVTDVTVHDSTVYVGGYFRIIGGQARPDVAALDARTGAATPWVPHVSALAVSGYTSAPCGAEPPTTPPSGSGGTVALLVTGATVYVAGGSVGHGGIGTYDATTGAATGWERIFDGPVLAIAAFGSTVYAGGDFTAIEHVQNRSGIAALDATTGAVTPWTPEGGGEVRALAVKGSIVYVGGVFSSIGGQPRSCIAALDATTGAATDWDPSAGPPPASGYYIPPSVRTLAVSGSIVYAAGDFGSIGGQTRNYIAALDAATGAATAWDPNPDSVVFDLAVNGSTVYAGGSFTSIGGQARNYVAALDSATGDATPWTPNADGHVGVLAASATTVYVGGDFTTIGGAARNHIAALDATTGAASEWNPDANGDVSTIAPAGSTVYAGGGFTSIGGQARNYIAALDATTGSAGEWNPDANGNVNAIALDGSTVYAGGEFTSIGGLPQARFAAMSDVTTPTLLSLVSAQAEPDHVRLTWFAGDGHIPGATVYRRTMREAWSVLGSILVDGRGRLVYEDTRVIAGERYGYRLGVLRAGVEEFLGEAWVDVPRSPEFALAGLRPNPASSGFTVAFSLPDAAPARLELLDIAGRRIVNQGVGVLGLGNHVLALAGDRRFAPGLYLIRLSRGGRSLRARALVIR